ncbi:transmembrane protein 14 A [Tieghemostelium lacteum]|uniref:Transmembrane protein 14 A n=1 Tax=Tieghemostelium lacteum TaxID=361077 RepID=A0A151Z749_TIELA|nr:transmembrane protein 14 A [Tieghemostelium lacteum]|eukprot:KYQ89790.1 transmembrane protein 14 A [Tieghemostelium lacteum]
MTLLVYVYACLLGVGGAIGYLKAGSNASLVSGLTSAGLVAYSAYLTNTNRRLGMQMTMVLSLGLLVVMGNRFLNSHKFMPAGLVALFSAAVLFKTFFSYQAL